MRKDYSNRRDRRRAKIKVKVRGTAKKPRLVVFRSQRFIYGQIIDDKKGVTLAAFSDQQLGEEDQKLSKTGRAKLVGQELAKQVQKKGIKAVVFDRAGYQYHGRVRAMAEGARERGLNF